MLVPDKELHETAGTGFGAIVDTQRDVGLEKFVEKADKRVGLMELAGTVHWLQ